MVKNADVQVRKAEDGDKSQLANLIHFETFVHRHLDWRPPLEWIGYQPFLISERNGQLVGALACPPDPPKIAWIRLFAISSSVPLNEGWVKLWQATKEILLKRDSMKILAIPLQEWFRSLLMSSKFSHIRDVKTLVWENGKRLPQPTRFITIRPMGIDDLPAVHEIDRTAFEDEWRNSTEAIEAAFHQATLASVALQGEKIIGYQISTGGPQVGHLARLAVHPDAQMRGVGYSLVYNLLEQFSQRGISQISVNTQQDNIASLRLYEKAKFTATDEIFPVYQFTNG